MDLSFRGFKKTKIAKKNHYFVIGNPVGHSLSPVMHNLALKHHRIEAEYIAIKLEQQELTEFIAWMNNDNFRGCNITTPYKAEFLSIVDEIASEADGLHAINTISKSSDGTRLCGTNTDPYGFIQPLKQYLGRIYGMPVIIFGTGGAARAVAHALQKEGITELILTSRMPDADKKTGLFGDCIITGYDGWQPYAEDTQLFINATPVGMKPLVHTDLLSDEDYRYMNNKICYDLIYNPSETLFLKKSRLAGAITMNGLEMLIYQGNRSFKIWTGQSFPIEKIKKELIQILYP